MMLPIEGGRAEVDELDVSVLDPPHVATLLGIVLQETSHMCKGNLKVCLADISVYLHFPVR